jgi:hypothetical protein
MDTAGAFSDSSCGKIWVTNEFALPILHCSATRDRSRWTVPRQNRWSSPNKLKAGVVHLD